MGEDQEDALVSSRSAWRRTWATLGLFAVAWAAAIVASAAYLPQDWYPLTFSFGQLAGGYGWAVWVGASKRTLPPVMTERDGRTYLSARTLAGRRTIDLGDLVSVRYAGPVGKPEAQESRVRWFLRDGQGMRLAIRVDQGRSSDLEEALRQAVRPADGRQPLELNLATSDRLRERQVRFGYHESGPDSFLVSIPVGMIGAIATGLVAGLVR